MATRKLDKASDQKAPAKGSRRNKVQPRALDAKLVARIYALVGDIEVNLDARLEPEDE